MSKHPGYVGICLFALILGMRLHELSSEHASAGESVLPATAVAHSITVQGPVMEDWTDKALKWIKELGTIAFVFWYCYWVTAKTIPNMTLEASAERVRWEAERQRQSELIDRIVGKCGGPK